MAPTPLLYGAKNTVFSACTHQTRRTFFTTTSDGDEPRLQRHLLLVHGDSWAAPGNSTLRFVKFCTKPETYSVSVAFPKRHTSATAAASIQHPVPNIRSTNAPPSDANVLVETKFFRGPWSMFRLFMRPNSTFLVLCTPNICISIKLLKSETFQ